MTQENQRCRHNLDFKICLENQANTKLILTEYAQCVRPRAFCRTKKEVGLGNQRVLWNGYFHCAGEMMSQIFCFASLKAHPKNTVERRDEKVVYRPCGYLINPGKILSTFLEKMAVGLEIFSALRGSEFQELQYTLPFISNLT